MGNSPETPPASHDTSSGAEGAEVGARQGDAPGRSHSAFQDSPATRPSTAAQRKLALCVCLAMALVTTALFPIASVQWARVPAFLPAYQTAVTIAYFMTAYLIYGHYRATRSFGLLYLCGGCLYTAVILAAQFMSIPGMFVPSGAILGGDQTTIWLWLFWHAGPSVAMLLYVLNERRQPAVANANPARSARRFGAFLLLVTCATLASVTVFQGSLPKLDVNGNFERITTSGIAPALQVLTLAALVLLGFSTRFRTVLQVWLGVALVALLFDNAITMLGGSRLSVGWYVGRANALVSATVMLLVYLREINQVYLKTVDAAEQLARSNSLLAVKADQARIDALTGLPGRARFLEMAEAQRGRSQLDKTSLVMLFIDLDGFKRVNDTLGHDQGDRVLVKAADALRRALRDVDIAGRFGGDEFVACVVANAPDIEATAKSVAGRIVASVGRIGDGIGCSVGVSICSPDCSDLESALRQADEAMYFAKKAGKGRYAMFGQPRLVIAA